MKDQGEPWFVYRRSPGKVSAVPANAAGWAVLIAFILATAALAMLVALTMRGRHPLVTVAVLMTLTPAAVFGFMRWVVVPHGREADDAGAQRVRR